MKKENEVTYEDYKQALKTINTYYRQLTGLNECIIFHMEYIQPIKQVIEEIEKQNLTKP